MLGIGWTEMLVVGVMALIVIGPKELPGMMQKIGRFAGMVRRMGSDFQRELNKTTGLDEVRNLRSSITAPLKQTTDAIRKEFNTVSSTGEVKPSGALKPADPKAESVVDEIHAAAGIKPPQQSPTSAPPAEAAPASPAPAPAVTAAAQPIKAPAQRKRVVKAKPAPTAPVTAAQLPPPESAKSKSRKAAPAAKPVESPAPAEAAAPARKPRRKSAAAPKAADGGES